MVLICVGANFLIKLIELCQHLSLYIFSRKLALADL